jgi:hypothetical protein
LLIEEIKNNNFSTRRATLPLENHYKTISNIIYNHKGNAAEVRAVLDGKKKEDLRINHFDIGGSSANVV